MRIRLVLYALIAALQSVEMKAKRSSQRFSRHTRVTELMSTPCHMPKPSSSSHFDTFCQFDYHKKPYICDPSGSLSRTEIEMLDLIIKPMNISSCFCSYSRNCHRTKYRMAIVVVPYTSIESLKECGISLAYDTPHTWSQVALTYGEELSRHWMTDCRADLLLVYIGAFGSEGINKAHIVPIYRNELQYLSQYSQPIAATTSRYSIYGAIDKYMLTAKKLINSGSQKIYPSIPSWAIFLSVGFIALAICSVYIANCLTNRSRGAFWQSRYPNGTKIRLANDRWRAGFGGGLMMQNNANAKGAMMFKQFGGRRTKQSDTARKI